MNRSERRTGTKIAMREMKQVAASGTWEPFLEIENVRDYPTAPAGLIRAWKNPIYTVQQYGHRTSWGLVSNLMVRRNDAAPVRSWRDMQRIKDELIGADREAIEVYPARKNLVDDANIYHLWVLPSGFTLPFGLHTESTTKIK